MPVVLVAAAVAVLGARPVLFSLATAGALLFSLATAGARVVIPKPLETQARAKPKSAVRVGGDRGNAVVRVGSLRGNAFEAVGFLAGDPDQTTSENPRLHIGSRGRGQV